MWYCSHSRMTIILSFICYHSYALNLRCHCLQRSNQCDQYTQYTMESVFALYSLIEHQVSILALSDSKLRNWLMLSVAHVFNFHFKRTWSRIFDSYSMNIKNIVIECILLWNLSMHGNFSLFKFSFYEWIFYYFYDWIIDWAKQPFWNSPKLEESNKQVLQLLIHCISISIIHNIIWN